jgi:hypothetical protein
MIAGPCFFVFGSCAQARGKQDICRSLLHFGRNATCKYVEEDSDWREVGGFISNDGPQAHELLLI